MSQPGSFNLDDLRIMMRTCAGVAESMDLNADIGDTTFVDLGYDSLAVLEMATKLQNQFGVVIPDDVVDPALTPQALVEYVQRPAAGLNNRAPGDTP